MKKYLMTLLMLGLACNAAACMEDEPFYDTEIPPHVSIDNSKGEGVTRLVTYNVGIFNKYIKMCIRDRCSPGATTSFSPKITTACC